MISSVQRPRPLHFIARPVPGSKDLYVAVPVKAEPVTAEFYDERAQVLVYDDRPKRIDIRV